MAANWCTVCLLVLPWFLDSSVFICMTMCTQWRKTIHRKIKLRRIRIHSPLHSTKLLNNFLLWIEKANYFERWTEKKQAAHFYIENKEETFSFTWFSRHRPNKYNPINQKKGDRSILFNWKKERREWNRQIMSSTNILRLLLCPKQNFFLVLFFCVRVHRSLCDSDTQKMCLQHPKTRKISKVIYINA